MVTKTRVYISVLQLLLWGHLNWYVKSPHFFPLGFSLQECLILNQSDFSRYKRLNFLGDWPAIQSPSWSQQPSFLLFIDRASGNTDHDHSRLLKSQQALLTSTVIQVNKIDLIDLPKWGNMPISLGFPCGSAGKECACSVGELGSICGLGRSLGEGKGCTLQYSGLENSILGDLTEDHTEEEIHTDQVVVFVVSNWWKPFLRYDALQHSNGHSTSVSSVYLPH